MSLPLNIFYSEVEFLQDENILPFEAIIALKILQTDKENVYAYLMQKSYSIDEKLWIKSLKFLGTDFQNSDLLGHCQFLGEKDYKLIPSLLGLKWKHLGPILWKLILLKNLACFLPPKDSNLGMYVIHFMHNFFKTLGGQLPTLPSQVLRP